MSEQVDTNLTPKKLSKKEKQRLFLASFAENGNVMLSARAAHVTRQTVYIWLEHDQDFSFAYNQAKEDVKDMLRAEIYRRAVQGYDEEVYQLAKYAGTVRKYSDTLLIFHSKALMEEYREKRHIDVTHTIRTEWGGGALEDEEVHDVGHSS